MNKHFEEQVKQFHDQIFELIKRYQFRDRNKDICCGISVSQCYILETLKQSGPLSMNVLAKKMHLTVSTVTRVIQPLLKKEFVSRKESMEDRRVRLISLTEEGRTFADQLWEKVIDSEKIIFENFPKENREMLIDFLRKLNSAINQWQSCCSG
jgi:DNA-binding MarR family transcriptional regulator